MGTPSSYTDDAIILKAGLEKLSIQGLNDRESQLGIGLKEQKLARSIVAARNSLAPIHSLPDEVLAEIFYHLDRTIRLLHSRHGVPLVHVLKVCRRWNAVALSTPRLWSCVTANNFHVTREMVKLSKVTPLSIFMDSSFCEPHIHDIMQVLSPQFERITSIWIDLDYACMSELLAYLTQPAPMLEDLRMVSTCDGNYGPTHRSLIAIPTTLFTRKAPALRSIDLRQVTIPFGALFCGLLQLRLEVQHPIHTPSMTEFLDVLEACPELQVLILQYAGPLLPDDVYEYSILRRLVKLHHLEYLMLHNDRPIDIAHLLAHIHVPPGCFINLTSTLKDINSDLSDILPRDCSALTPLVGLNWLRFCVDNFSSTSISGGSSQQSVLDFGFTLFASKIPKAHPLLLSLSSFFPLANLEVIEFIDCAPYISKQQYVEVLSHLSGVRELSVSENPIARQMQLLEALKSPPITESKEKSVICPKLKILRFQGLDCIDVVIENVARCCRARTLCGTPLEVLTISGLCDADVEKLSAVVPVVNNHKWYTPPA